MPPELQKAIEQARNALKKHPQYQLPPFYRMAIYAAIASLGEPQARLLRGTLAILTARHVLSVWQKELPANPWPERLLERAEQVLRGEVSPEVGSREAEEEFERAASEYETLEAQGLTVVGHCVLLAAVEALFEASGEYRLWQHLDEHETDAGLDPDCEDTASWAWAASSGAFDSTSQTTSFDIAKSKGFWEWWLFEAIPEAWQYGSSPEQRDTAK